ncbi:MAG: hypothetical protein HKM04_00310 [Legionellales bacterium]|nr:hypothetical protein [Legionellales bacterium]
MTNLKLRDYLPAFSSEQEPSVYIENTRFDAKKFKYEQPFVMLGKAGFFVDYGYRLAYFPSTWQGLPNPSFRFQDMQTLCHFAENRSRKENDFDIPQLGLWSNNWHIAGTDEHLVRQLERYIPIALHG